MLRGKRILIVEDEALVAMMVEDALRAVGAEVEVATTVSDALRLLDEAPMDAAVLDCNVAGDMVTPVADKAAELGVPFLFATGYSEEYAKGTHVNAAVLTKPYDPAKVVSVLAAFFRATRYATRAPRRPSHPAVRGSYSSRS